MTVCLEKKRIDDMIRHLWFTNPKDYKVLLPNGKIIVTKYIRSGVLSDQDHTMYKIESFLGSTMFDDVKFIEQVDEEYRIEATLIADKQILMEAEVKQHKSIGKKLYEKLFTVLKYFGLNYKTVEG